MKDFVNYVTSLAFLESITIAIIMFVLLYVIKKYLIKKVAYTNKDETHKNTLKGVVFNVLQYVIILTSIFCILTVNGLDVTGLITGLGIVATIIGLALQDTIKDIFMGINIYNNNFYKVGDVVLFKDAYWEVKFFNARVTKLKHLANNSTLTFVNSQIVEINKIKEDNCFMIYFDYDEDKKLIDKAFKNMIPRINDLYGVREAKYFGVCSMDLQGVKYGIGFKNSPKLIIGTNASVAAIAYEEFNKLGIKPASDDEVKVKQLNKKKTK